MFGTLIDGILWNWHAGALIGLFSSDNKIESPPAYLKPEVTASVRTPQAVTPTPAPKPVSEVMKPVAKSTPKKADSPKRNTVKSASVPKKTTAKASSAKTTAKASTRKTTAKASEKKTTAKVTKKA